VKSRDGQLLTGAAERVQAIFRDVFDDPKLVLQYGMKASDAPEWDSLNHINLIVALETEFNVTFDEDEIAGVTSVEDIFAHLARHGVDDLPGR
jgi:acyl carrier protein